MASIFISYRREDAQGDAQAICDRLRKAFGNDIFMDVSGIGVGDDFVQTIQETIPKCDVFLCLISKMWLAAKGADGGRRIDDNNDPVRMETFTALKEKVSVIPVLLRTEMPIAEDLPEDIRPLHRINAFRIWYENNRFDDNCDKLLAEVKKSLARTRQRRAPDRTGRWLRVPLWLLAGLASCAALALLVWIGLHLVTPKAVPTHDPNANVVPPPQNPAPDSVTPQGNTPKKPEPAHDAPVRPPAPPVQKEPALTTARSCPASIPEWEHSVQMNPKDGEANFRLGTCLIEQGNENGGLSYLTEASKYAKDPAPAFTELARQAWRKRDETNAVRYIDKALDANQGFPPAMLLRGQIYLETGRPREAYQLLRDLWAQTKSHDVCVAFQRASQEFGVETDPKDCSGRPR